MNGVMKYRSKEWYEEKAQKRMSSKVIVPVDYDSPKPYNRKREWNKYRDEVREITKQQDLQSLEHYDKRITKELIGEHGFKIYRSEVYYSLDHKTSIWYGWKNNISPDVIGDISNLRYILCIENTKKGIKCE
jgi:hypothetical protein